MADHKWLRFEEMPMTASDYCVALVVRADQVLGFGERFGDGKTWLRTTSEAHIVTATVDEIVEMLNAPEWAAKEE